MSVTSLLPSFALAELDLDPKKLHGVKLCINWKCNPSPDMERLDTFIDDRWKFKQNNFFLKHREWEAHKLDDFFMMKTMHLWQWDTPLPGYLTRALIILYTSAVSKGCNPFFLFIALHLVIKNPQTVTSTPLLIRFKPCWWELPLPFPQLISMLVNDEIQRKILWNFCPSALVSICKLCHMRF